jgi:hypothetical protein
VIEIGELFRELPDESRASNFKMGHSLILFDEKKAV